MSEDKEILQAVQGVMKQTFNSLRNAVLVDTIEVVAISVSPHGPARTPLGTSLGKAGQLLRSQLITRSNNDLQPWVKLPRAAVEARTPGGKRRIWRERISLYRHQP